MSAIKINPQKTALFLCDIQERFRTAIFQFESVVATSRKLVEGAKLLNVPVYATEQNPKALGATVSEIGFESLSHDLNPLSGAKPKTRFSMMIPEVRESLHRREIKSVLIVGIESHVCVLQTCLDLIEQGYQPHIIADGISSCNAQEIPIAIERMRQAGACVTTSESVLFQLMGDASHPQFRAISKLVKEEKAATSSSLQKLMSHL